jgi:hypothetical protein
MLKVTSFSLQKLIISWNTYIESLDPTQTPPQLCLEVCTKQAHRLKCPQLIKLNRAKPSEVVGFLKLPFLFNTVFWAVDINICSTIHTILQMHKLYLGAP